MKSILKRLLETWAKEKIQHDLDKPQKNEVISGTLTLEKTRNDEWVCQCDFVSKTLVDMIDKSVSFEENTRHSSPSF